MYCGHIEIFIHYPMWSWDEVQYLLVHGKACGNQWYDSKVAFASIFLCIFHLHYSKEYVYKSTINLAKIIFKNSKDYVGKLV
jgi:hypothetical protein